MMILAIVLIVLGVLLMKGGSGDTARVGLAFLLGAVAIFALKVDFSALDGVIFDVVGKISQGVRAIAWVLGCILVFIFLGPLLMLFGGKK